MNKQEKPTGNTKPATTTLSTRGESKPAGDTKPQGTSISTKGGGKK